MLQVRPCLGASFRWNDPKGLSAVQEPILGHASQKAGRPAEVMIPLPRRPGRFRRGTSTVPSHVSVSVRT